MAEGDSRILQAQYVKHPTVEIPGVRQVTVSPSVVSKVDPGVAGATGQAASLLTYSGVDVQADAYAKAFSLKSASHDGNAITSIVYARVSPRSVYRVDPGDAAAPGVADVVVTYYELAVELYGLDYSEMLGFLGASAGDVVLGLEGAAGADQTITLASVYLDTILAPVRYAAPDSGGAVEACGVGGRVNFTSGQTFGDVFTGDLDDVETLLGKVGGAAANAVVGFLNAGGTAMKTTIKNVIWCEPIGGLELAAPDAGGPVPTSIGLHGIATWGDSDTFATMLVDAADV